jgi:addiction module HigA family antidote
MRHVSHYSVPMTMKGPPHPGRVVIEKYIEPLGLTITRAAEALGVTRNTLSELVNGKRGISPEMVVRLATVFGGPSTAGSCSRPNATWRRSGEAE